MAWLEDAGHRVTAFPVSEAKSVLHCSCGWERSCLCRNENYWRNQHWRRTLRTWE